MMKQKRISRNLTLLAIVVFLVFPSYFGVFLAAQKAAKGKTKLVKKHVVPVIELHNLEQLKEAFQRDAGKVRLVTILSPT